MKPPNLRSLASRVLPSNLPEPLKREIRGVLRLAIPVILIQIGSVFMGTVDTMMLGRYSAEALAAGALGHTITFALIGLPMGILMVLDPMIAQAYGAGNGRRVREAFGQGLALAILLSIPLAILSWDIGWLLRLTGQPEAIHDDTVFYLRGLIPGHFGFLLFIAGRQTLQALSCIRPLALPIILANIANAGLNYLLIFGKWGFPELGVLGSSWATSISRWVLFLGILLAMPGVFRRLKLTDKAEPWSWLRLWRPFKWGLPIGFHMSLEIWLFATISMSMGYLGTHELAGHQVAITLCSLTFMIPLGLGAAAATRVGNAVGAQDPVRTRYASITCLALGTGVMFLSALTFWFLPELLTRAFTDDRVVIQMAAALLPIAAMFQVFDGLQVVGSGVLRGTGDTRWPAALALIGYWCIGIPIAFLLAFRLDFGPEGLWWGMTAGLGSVAILLLLRIRRRLNRPIEDLLLQEI